MLKWPDREAVAAALVEWASRLSAGYREVRRVGVYGSFARADWGVGSDLDLVVVVDQDSAPPAERARRYDTTALPVQADVMVLTEEELSTRIHAGGRFSEVLANQVRWLLGNDSLAALLADRAKR